MGTPEIHPRVTGAGRARRARRPRRTLHSRESAEATTPIERGRRALPREVALRRGLADGVAAPRSRSAALSGLLDLVDENTVSPRCWSVQHGRAGLGDRWYAPPEIAGFSTARSAVTLASSASASAGRSPADTIAVAGIRAAPHSWRAARYPLWWFQRRTDAGLTTGIGARSIQPRNSSARSKCPKVLTTQRSAEISDQGVPQGTGFAVTPSSAKTPGSARSSGWRSGWPGSVTRTMRVIRSGR